MLTFDNFARILADAVDNQRSARPPPEWGRNLVDDDYEPRMPTSPAFSRLSKQSDLEFDIDFANELENSIAEVYGKEVNDPEIKEVGKEMQKIFNKARAGTEVIQAKRLGTLHANKKMVPRGKYRDTEAYHTVYNTALNKTSQKDDVMNSQQGEGKTRQEKKLSVEEKLAAGRVFREPLETANRRIIFDNDDEAEILQQEIDSINLSMPESVRSRSLVKYAFCCISY